MQDTQTTTLICPKNDEESLMILKIANTIHLNTLTSGQPHGARLEKEKNLLARILETNPETTTVVIVELPGPKTEAELQAEGFTVKIIDHHRYDDLDRMQKKSSLEQFLDLFKITDKRLDELGFDAKMVRAVGAIDRGFIWELKNEQLTEPERKEAVRYYRALTMELGEERREREEEAALDAWEEREERDGVIIVRSLADDISIRDALSFIVAENYPDTPPQTLIIQGKHRMYVQESKYAKDLHLKFGGFTFGRDACWGVQRDDHKLPSLDEVLAVIVK